MCQSDRRGIGALDNPDKNGSDVSAKHMVTIKPLVNVAQCPLLVGYTMALEAAAITDIFFQKLFNVLHFLPITVKHMEG